MSTSFDTDLKKYIEFFNPLDKIDLKYRSHFSETMAIENISTGSTIIRKNKLSTSYHFLVEGDIEVRLSFDNRLRMNHDTPQCRNPLENLLNSSKGSIKAASDCRILTVNSDKLEQTLSWHQNVGTLYTGRAELSLETEIKIDDNFSPDWDTNFVKSPLAANLPSSIIQQLFSQLEEIQVNAGDVIVKNQSKGDFFYIVKTGVAEVQTEQKGPYKGKTFELIAGDYFGDEALVADTIRNATVTMLTEGTLGRLDNESFIQLIKQHLVTHLTPDVHFTPDQIQIIDVRLPIEYRGNHKEGSSNIPISTLRRRMRDLKQSQLYVVSPANDNRSVLATYLLRQAGFQAYQWSELKQQNTIAV